MGSRREEPVMPEGARDGSSSAATIALYIGVRSELETEAMISQNSMVEILFVCNRLYKFVYNNYKVCVHCIHIDVVSYV